MLLIQVFIGFGWLRAASEKIIDPAWWSGDVIRQFVVSQQDNTLPWFEPFLDYVVIPMAPVVALVVVALQLLVGVSLLTGRRLAIGLGVGIGMNLCFLAAGAVTPSAFYLLAQGAVLLWMAERRPTPRKADWLQDVAAVSAFFAALNLPLIRTVHPAHVIEDPAMMFSFGALLAAMGCLVARNHA